MRSLINLSIKLITVICVMFRNIYKEPRLIHASILTMSKFIPIQFLQKRKLSDSSEMPFSYADAAKKPAQAPPHSGSSRGKTPGQGNYNHQAPRGRDDRRNDPPPTSVDRRKSSSSSGDRNGPQGRQVQNYTHQPFDNPRKHSNNKSRNNKQPWNKEDRGGNRGGQKGKGTGHYESHQTPHGNNKKWNQDHDNSNRSGFRSEDHNWGAGKKLGNESSQTSQVNNQNRNQEYGKRNSGDFVNEGPEFPVHHRQQSESSTTDMAERSRQNSESNASSGKSASQPVMTSHSSDSSTNFPCSESTVSHSLSASEENQATSLPPESPPPSDRNRKTLAMSPVGSHSFSGPPAASETQAETMSSPTQSKKPVGWSDPGTKGKKKSGQKNTAERNAGLMLTNTKTVESQEPGKGKGVWKGVDINELRRAPECFRECKSLATEVNESADRQFDRPESQEQHRGKFVPPPSFVFLPHQQQPGIAGSSFRWGWDQIVEILSNKITHPIQLEEVMAAIAYHNPQKNRYHGPQSNPNERPDFSALTAYFQTLTEEQYNRFLYVTLPNIQKLALQLPFLFQKPLPILKKQTNQEVTLSQLQVACLLANAFFSTFPDQNYNRNGKPLQMPSFNFIKLYSFNKSERKVEKLKCIVNYFERVTTNMPDGFITYKRVYRKPECWMTLESKLTKLHVSTEGTIEDERGFLQADFANKFVGGGVLNTGLVQEEIRFVLCPEMIVSCLITEMLTDDEVLVMIGCERFSSYFGYSDTFKFAGNFVDKTERDERGRKYTEVVAMDASVFRNDFYEQFAMKHVVRELNKAHCAFEGSDARLQGSKVQLEGSHGRNMPAVCTGNWGCGAFGGDKQLKALIQLMAASVANRDICYLTFGDTELCLQIGHMYDILTSRNMSIKDIMDILTEYSKSTTSDSLFTFMEKMIYANVHTADNPNKSQEKSTKSDFSKNTKQEKPNRSDNPKNTNVQSKSPNKHNK